MKVFLDANVVIRAGKPPGGPILDRLTGLVDAGIVTVLTTDLTCQEVAKKHAENDYKVIKEVGHPHFRNVVKLILDADLPDITKADLKAKLFDTYGQSTRSMFERLDSKMLSIDNIKPSTVFSDYAANKGFFTYDSKKDQFPDAFIFECLKAEASEDEPVVIVSNDGDFSKPVESEPYISIVDSLPEFFETLGLEVEAPEIEDFFELQIEELADAVNEELNDWWLYGDVADSEIDEICVTKVESWELMSFGSTEEGNPIMVVGSLLVKADILYTHPDWDTAIYDSEEKIYFELHHISGETEVSLNVDVSMLIEVDENGNPVGINELSFRNDDFQYIQLHPFETYK